MAREIEIKIPLTKDEYQRLMELTQGKNVPPDILLETPSPEYLIKTDEYFSRYDTEKERRASDEPRVIRIRSELTETSPGKTQMKGYFCIKYKKIENGIEFNSENETYVEEPEILVKFFEISGYKKYFEKRKESYGVYCRLKDVPEILMHMELVTVNGLHYIETEVTQNTEEPDKVRKVLEEFITRLGLDVSKKDSRSWMEIIKENT